MSSVGDDHGRSEADLRSLARVSTRMRRWVIERSLASNVGHVGSALSIIEIVAVLWEEVMRNPGSERPDRDRFILAKGHASLALYCALHNKGILDEGAFETFCRDDSLLGVHPEHALAGVDVSTGSLGQGLSVACGLALGLRRRGFGSHIYVLMSDAECNEGQIWEAAMFAAQHRLSNITAIIDSNGLQAMGHTRGILDLQPMREKWQAFGWQARDVDGHSPAALLDAFAEEPAGSPRVLVAQTVLGRGVSFMQDQLEWHYRNLTSELAERALAEIGSEA